MSGAEILVGLEYATRIHVHDQTHAGTNEQQDLERLERQTTARLTLISSP